MVGVIVEARHFSAADNTSRHRALNKKQHLFFMALWYGMVCVLLSCHPNHLDHQVALAESNSILFGIVPLFQ